MNSDNNFEADELMIRGVSLFGRARSLKGISKLTALKELIKGARLMNRSIKLSPERIPNRMTRLRHMLGATMRSPRSFHKQIKADIDFIDNCIDSLSKEERANFLCAKGEYKHFLGDVEGGIALIKEASRTAPDSFLGQYSRVMYEKLIKERE